MNNVNHDEINLQYFYVLLKKQQYGRKQYKITPEDEKQKLVEYRKKY